MNDMDKRAEKVFKKHKELLEKKQRTEGQLESIQEEMKKRGFSSLEELKDALEELGLEQERLEKKITGLLEKAENEIEKVHDDS